MQITKIAVSGATGFLGSALCHEFYSRGFQVLALKRSTSNTARLTDILELISCHNVDHEGADELLKSCAQVDVIVHTATNYGRQGGGDSEIEKANLNFPLELLDVAIRCNASAFINTDTILSRELNQYAATKANFVDEATRLVCDSNLRFINIKLQQMYGPWDDESKMPARLIRECMRNVPVFDLTEGEQLRDLIFVDDVVSAYCCIVEQLQNFTPGVHEIELGTGAPVSIRNFSLLVKQLTNSATELRFGVVSYRDGEDMLCTANIDAMGLLGWECKVSLKEGLLKTIEQEFVT